jgi:very-short-patch-repair endonuclease
LAAGQHGVVGRSQLLELGMRPGAIDTWVARERLHVVHRSVYAIGHEPLTARGRLMAAVLASGPGAVASHRTAAWLWGLLPDVRSVIDVTVSVRRRGRAGIAIHQSTLADQDRSRADGIPVTAVPRTLLDVAEVVNPRLLERAIDAAERSRRFDLTALDELIARSHGRHGLKRLREGLGAHRPPTVSRSELERRFMELLAAADLPLPSQNANLHGYEVDAVWEQHKLIVELDGYEFHRTRSAFERDRERDAALQALGWRVLRFSWRQVIDDPASVVAALRPTLTQPW